MPGLCCLQGSFSKEVFHFQQCGRSVHAASICKGTPREVCWLAVNIHDDDRFYVALFSALKRTHCAFITHDSK